MTTPSCKRSALPPDLPSRRPARRPRRGTWTRGSSRSSSGPSSRTHGSTLAGRPGARAGRVRRLRARRRADRGRAPRRRRDCAASSTSAATTPRRSSPEAAGCAKRLRCPTTLDLHARGAAQGGACLRGRAQLRPREHGLVPVATATWENWVFVRLAKDGPRSRSTWAPRSSREVAKLGLSSLHWFDRMHYVFDCNWKVFVDNYLDGGYTLPTMHEASAACSTTTSTERNGRRHCLQSSPMVTRGAEAETGAVRKASAPLLLVLPELHVQLVQGVMDTNLVYPRGVDQTEVIFDFWFADSDRGRARVQPCLDRHRQPRSGRGRGHLPVGASAGCTRAPTITGGGCRCGARRASSSSTGCCTRTLRGGARAAEPNETVSTSSSARPSTRALRRSACRRNWRRWRPHRGRFLRLRFEREYWRSATTRR